VLVLLSVGATDTVKDGVSVGAIVGRDDNETTEGEDDGSMEGRLDGLMDKEEDVVNDGAAEGMLVVLKVGATDTVKDGVIVKAIVGMSDERVVVD